MRARVYWPVTIAAALLVGLLAYGLTTTGTDTTLDAATAKGDRVDPPTASALPVLGGGGTGSPAGYPGQGVLGNLVGAGGGPASLAAYGGRCVRVKVWASWCEPCRDELPLIEKAHKTLSARGGTVLGI